jgi:hypothetical protein
LDDACLNAIHNAVALVNAAAPIAGKITTKRLGFTKALVPVAVNIFQELEDTLEGPAVLFCPIFEVFPGLI